MDSKFVRKWPSRDAMMEQASSSEFLKTFILQMRL